MIEFEESTHTYKIDGVVVPSVSEIMTPLTSLYYKEIDKNILDMACYRGSQVHKAIEDFETWGEYTIDDKYKDYMLNYKIFKKFNEIEIINQEQRLTNGKFAGTYDMLAKIDNKTILIDHKTSKEIHNNLLSVQFAGYNELCEANGIKVDEFYCLHLTKSKYEFRKIEINKEIWKKCKDIYFYIKEEK